MNLIGIVNTTGLTLAALRYQIQLDELAIGINLYAARRTGPAHVREPLLRIHESLERWRQLVPAMGANVVAAQHSLRLVVAHDDDLPFAEKLLADARRLMQLVVTFVADVECDALSESSDTSRVDEVRAAVETAKPLAAVPASGLPPNAQLGPTATEKQAGADSARAAAWRLAAVGFAQNNPTVLALAANDLERFGSDEDRATLAHAVRDATAVREELERRSAK